MTRMSHSTEAQLHESVAAFLAYALPSEAVFFHVPNGEKRDKGTAKKLMRMGVAPGIPDICIIHGGRAIFIELKTRKGTTSNVQSMMHERLRIAGGLVFICRDLIAVEDTLRPLMRLRGRVAA